MDSLERFIRAAPLPPSLPKNNNSNKNGGGNDGGNSTDADGNGIADNAGQGQHRRALVHASLATAVGRKGRHLSGTFCLTGDTMEGIIQCLVFLKAFSVSFGQNKSFYQFKKKNKLKFYHSLWSGRRCPASLNKWQRNYVKVYSKSFRQECVVKYVWVRSALFSWLLCFWTMSSDQAYRMSVGSGWMIRITATHTHTVCQTCTQRKFLWFDEMHIVHQCFTSILHSFFLACGWSRLIYIPIKDNCDGNFYRTSPTISFTLKLISNYYAGFRKLCDRSSPISQMGVFSGSKEATKWFGELRRQHHSIFARSTRAHTSEFLFSEEFGRHSPICICISKMYALNYGVAMAPPPSPRRHDSWMCALRLCAHCTSHSTHNIEFIIYMEIRTCCGVSDSAFSTFSFRLSLRLQLSVCMWKIMTKSAILRSKNRTKRM